MTRATLAPALAALALALPAAAQQGGGHPDMQTVVLESLVAIEGRDCGVLQPWEAAVLRAEARKLYDKFEPAERPALRKEALERAAAMTCDDPLPAAYAKAHRGIWETEELPRFLAAYRALALLDEPPAVFVAAAAGRLDFDAPLRAIEVKLAALETAGVKAPGGQTWIDFADRTRAGLATRLKALSGEAGSTRDTPDDVAAYVVEAATVTEAWLAEKE